MATTQMPRRSMLERQRLTGMLLRAAWRHRRARSETCSRCGPQCGRANALGATAEVGKAVGGDARATVAHALVAVDELREAIAQGGIRLLQALGVLAVGQVELHVQQRALVQ